MVDTHVILSFARIATAALAGTISILGFRAYFASRKRSILALGLGAGLLALGYFAEGLLVEVGRWSVHDATVLESIVTLVAAAVLVASLYVRDGAHRRTIATPAPGAGP